jgi:hypothetical protein
METHWRATVKTYCPSLLIIVSLLSLAGCGKKLPEAYGVYADTNHGQILLQGQNVQAVGNIMNYFPGLAEPSGPACNSIEYFIVYQKDLAPNSVGLAKLQFLKDGDISTLIGFGTTRVPVNLWVPNKDHIDLEVKPVERRQDMYIFRPRISLEKGFYALYIGQFGAEVGSERRVYDLVVGSVNDFPSYASAMRTSQNTMKGQATVLLEQMNQFLNKGDYQHIEGVYRPDGRVLSGAGLQAFITGNRTWLSTAGKILKSDVIAVMPLDENNARCTVKTTYQKAGVQEESVTIRKIGRQYYLTDIQ